MGGFGSGRTGGQPVTADALRLDMMALIQQRLVRPGQHSQGMVAWKASDGRLAGLFTIHTALTDPTAAWVDLRLFLKVGFKKCKTCFC